jgi:serine/threonine-protein kinase
MSGFERSWTKRARARLGRVLKDRWKLERLMGVGGSAAVYQARHRNGQRVAVKVLHANLSDEAELRQRFVREGYIANKVGHPAAVTVMDDDIDEEGSVFLVMDLLEGENVEQRWKRHHRTIPPEEVLVIAAQTLDVLEAAHAKKIVHRDIKPENLFLMRDGQLRVLDFGIARLRESMSRIQVTQSGVAMGTPAYMAPEQARGRSELVDGQTDLWALGATMFTLLTGHLVHEAATGNEQLLAAMLRPAPPLAVVLPAAPPCVAHVVDRALAYEKADRFADAAEMRDAVRRAYEKLVGAPMGSAARLVVPAADALGECGGPPGWDVSEVDPAITPSSRRRGKALRARWRGALAVGFGLGAMLAATMSAVLAWRHSSGTAAAASGAQPMAMATPDPTPIPTPTPTPTLTPTPTPTPTPPSSATSTQPAKPKPHVNSTRVVNLESDDDDPGPIRK